MELAGENPLAWKDTVVLATQVGRRLRNAVASPYVAVTRIPQTASRTAAPNISKAWWSVVDKALANFRKAIA
jgi:hypothetical protein